MICDEYIDDDMCARTSFVDHYDGAVEHINTLLAQFCKGGNGSSRWQAGSFSQFNENPHTFDDRLPL